MSTTPIPPKRPGGLSRHRLDLVSLVFGTLFFTVGLLAITSPAGLDQIDSAAAAGVAAIVGGLVLLLSLVPTRRRMPQAQPLPPPPVLIPTPEQVREEDTEWFGLSTPLTEIEKEVLRALDAEGEQSGEADQPDGEQRE